MKFLDGHIRFILAKNFIDESFELRNSYWQVFQPILLRKNFFDESPEFRDTYQETLTTARFVIVDGN